MVYYCTESCYYNDCGICTKGNCPRFDADEIEEEDENSED